MTGAHQRADDLRPIFERAEHQLRGKRRQRRLMARRRDQIEQRITVEPQHVHAPADRKPNQRASRLARLDDIVVKRIMR